MTRPRTVTTTIRLVRGRTQIVVAICFDRHQDRGAAFVALRHLVLRGRRRRTRWAPAVYAKLDWDEAEELGAALLAAADRIRPRRTATRDGGGWLS